MEKIKVVEFGYRHCPHCGGEMYLLESKYVAYTLAGSGNYVSNKVKEDSLTEFVCSECGYHVQAEHSIFGILPTESKILKEHEKEVSKQHLAKEIGYVEKGEN